MPARILGDACVKLREFSVDGTQLDDAMIADHVSRSLMLVTARSPVIGYDNASTIAHKADDEGTTLREAAEARHGNGRFVNGRPDLARPRSASASR